MNTKEAPKHVGLLTALDGLAQGFHGAGRKQA